MERCRFIFVEWHGERDVLSWAAGSGNSPHRPQQATGNRQVGRDEEEGGKPTEKARVTGSRR